MNILQECRRYKINPGPTKVKPGDIFICDINDKGIDRRLHFQISISEIATIDTVIIFNTTESIFGLKKGSVGAVFGKSE